MKKVFVMQESERENIQKMSADDVQNYLKGDQYDHLREKIYHKDITVAQFESALVGVEATIEKMKKERSIPETTFDPFEDRVAIFPDEKEVMTTSGLYMPEDTKNKPLKGTVVVVGPGKDGKPIPLVRGDKVYYGKYSGTPIPSDDGREILVMRMADIFGKV